MPPSSRTPRSDRHDFLEHRLRDQLDYPDRLPRHGSRLTPETFDNLMAGDLLRRNLDSSPTSRPTRMARRGSPISEGMSERTESAEETSSNATTLQAVVRRLTRERDAARAATDAALEQLDDTREALSDIVDSVEQLRYNVQQSRSQTRRTRNGRVASLTTGTGSMNSDGVAPCRTQ